MHNSWDEFTLRDAETRDLRKMHLWRNSERIRKTARQQKKFSFEEHRQWFSSIKRPESRRRVFVFDFQHTAMGVVTTIELSPGQIEWGFYIGPDKAPKGLGTVMAFLALQSFFRQGAFEVIGTVLESNEASYEFHKKLGFVEVSRAVEEKSRGREIRMVLSRSRWRELEEEMRDRLREKWQ